ncbi:unnamed protein product [Sympodiomycopsis kandeliae]
MGDFGSEDFISFDFEGDAGPSTEVENIAPGESSPRSKKSSKGRTAKDGKPSSSSQRRQSPVAASGTDTPQSFVSTSSKGKKRKFDDEDDEQDGFSSGRTKKERERAAARGTPWSVDVNWNTARNAAQQLHRELIAFERWLSPTKREHDCRMMVIELIRKAIISQWRDADVLSFGSQDTELYLPQGDIDLVVVSDSMERQRREGVLRAMAACLRRNNLATDVQVIARAKVPIIKFVCTHGKYRCDISVNQTNGLKAAEYVNQMQSEMPAIRPLIMLTKHLLQQRGMSEVYTGGLGSFSVILLVINFMQVHPKVQRGEIDATRNLGVLFLDFLELYGKNFGYDDTGITVRGKGGYFHKARRGWKDHTKPWKLSIEDPQNPDNDISTGSYNIISVRSALSGAFDMLTSAVCLRGIEMARGGGSDRNRSSRTHHRFDADEEDDAAARAALLAGPASRDKDPQSLLGSIIGVSRDLIKSRKDLAALYDSGVLQRLCGKQPPGRDPSPGPSSSRDESRRHSYFSRTPSPPASPPPPSSSPPPPPPPRSPPRQGSGVQSVVNIKGSAKSHPVQQNGSSKTTKGPQHSTPLRKADKRGKAPASSDEDDEDEDSRYAQAPNGKSRSARQTKKPRRSAYVSEESESGSDSMADEDDSLASDSDSDEDSYEVDDSDGGGVSRAIKKKSNLVSKPKSNSKSNSKSQDYWLNKGGVGGHFSEDDEDDYQYAYSDSDA